MNIVAPSAVTTRLGTDAPHVASPSQRAAIEAAAGAMLVLAGPGAGKTFCLIERIRFLIEVIGVDPVRICAFTFTNRAAEEISSRLGRQLGYRAEMVKRGTIHAFCAELLRELGTHVGLSKGFGIADDEYQLEVLRRVGVPSQWCKNTLARFCAHRFRGEELQHPNDISAFDRYERFLAKHNVLDFDSLVLRCAELFEIPSPAVAIRSRWDVILVDEFQDLNPVQYKVVRELARDHKHVFAVGDDEQSVYSWTGADRKVFSHFLNDFGCADKKVSLVENRRCPRGVFAPARQLVAVNPQLFSDRVAPTASKDSPFPISALAFNSDDAEAGWITNDIATDRRECGHDLSEVALLYRTHEVGYRLESELLGAGIPSRLAHGRALSEDPAVAYVLAALRVIANPRDVVYRDAFFAAILPKALYDEARARAEEASHELLRHLQHIAVRLGRSSETGRQIKRAVYTWRNLAAVGARHIALGPLIEDLLSQRVGQQRSMLEENESELSDPAGNAEVVLLAQSLRVARDLGLEIWLPLLGGAGIALRGMLLAATFSKVTVGGIPTAGAMVIDENATPSLGPAVGLFKALQLLESGEGLTAFRNFTTVDIETTDKAIGTSEVVEIAAVRVRDGQIVDRFNSLVKPRVSIAAAATRVHGLSDRDVADASPFENVWPKFKAFCGADTVVAHNGYQFDFPILRGMVTSRGGRFELRTYDTLPLARDLCPASRKLADLAHAFNIDTGREHRAVDDCNTLAHVYLRLEEMKVARARKTALINLLGLLGVALAACDLEQLKPEARLLLRLSRVFALGRYSGALEFYEEAAARVANASSLDAREAGVASIDEIIAALGGPKLMAKIRAEKSADDRYPTAMLRVRRLVAQIGERPLDEQVTEFLMRAVLSKTDGFDAERGRVNLLTLHSTKGLEFSRVYIVGVEDGQMPGISATKVIPDEEIEEARRLLYVGMTRTKDRLVLTSAETRNGKPSGGHRFLDEMALVPRQQS